MWANLGQTGLGPPRGARKGDMTLENTTAFGAEYLEEGAMPATFGEGTKYSCYWGSYSIGGGYQDTGGGYYCKGTYTSIE